MKENAKEMIATIRKYVFIILNFKLKKITSLEEEGKYLMER